jgi:hypothetical protein
MAAAVLFSSSLGSILTRVPSSQGGAGGQGSEIIKITSSTLYNSYNFFFILK